MLDPVRCTFICNTRLHIYQNAFAQIFIDPIGSWHFYESVNIPHSGNVVLHEGFETSLLEKMENCGKNEIGS